MLCLSAPEQNGEGFRAQNVSIILDALLYPYGEQWGCGQWLFWQLKPVTAEEIVRKASTSAQH